MSQASSGRATSRAGAPECRGWVEPTRPIHIEEVLAQGLREQDVDELAALGQLPEVALVQSYELSAPHCFSIMADGRAVGLFGAADLPEPGQGTPWMLASDGIFTVVRDFVRQAPRWVEYLNHIHPVLHNIVHLENTVSIRWLGRMGFLFDYNAWAPKNFVRFHRVHGRSGGRRLRDDDPRLDAVDGVERVQRKAGRGAG